MRIAPRRTRRTASTQPLLDKENRRDREGVTATRKARHRLSTTELARLEDVFGKQTHPSRQQKKELATELGMDYKTVTIWFQNKRQASKRGQPPVERPDKHRKRTRADSCLRTVSSPSLNATLDTSDAHPTTTSPDKSSENGLNTTTSDAGEEIKPLLDASNALAPRLREHPESDEGPDVDGTDVVHQSQSLSLPESPSEFNHHDQTTEHGQTNARSSKWKRIRTLEWACERLAKRRKLSKGGYARLGSEESQDGDANARVDSALSLLSFASSVQEGPSKDVMRGASLLLSFKHSWSRK